MTTETLPAVYQDADALSTLERVIVTGDLARLEPKDRVTLYVKTCQSLGLNPLTRPFEYISLNNKLTLYVRKDATDQLRRLHGVTVTELRREKDAELGTYTVYAHGRDVTGREDESTGVVNVKGLAGETLANAVMKAETKAKRRLTLSLVGLGFLDEIEVEGAERVAVDPETGEVLSGPSEPPKTLLDSVNAQRQALAGDAEQSKAPRRGRRAAQPEAAADATFREETSASPEPEDLSFGEDRDDATPADPEPIDQVEFMQRIGRTEGVTHELVVSAARDLFPGVKNLSALSDQARGRLWATVAERAAAQSGGTR